MSWVPVGAAFDASRPGSPALMRGSANTLRDLSVYRDLSSALAPQRRIRPVMVRPVMTGGEVDLVNDGEHVPAPAPAAELAAPVPDGARAGR